MPGTGKSTARAELDLSGRSKAGGTSGADQRFVLQDSWYDIDSCWFKAGFNTYESVYDKRRIRLSSSEADPPAGGQGRLLLWDNLGRGERGR